MRIRSPILAKMPQTHVGFVESTKRTGSRLIILAPIIAVFIFLVALVQLHILPESGPGRALYYLHDTLFLPFKGYTYTMFHPYSLVWWIIILLVLVLAIVSFLLGRSFLKRPHIWLVRRLVHHPNTYWYLVNGSRVFNYFGLKPNLIRLVAQRELGSALMTLSAQPLNGGSQKQCRSVSDLTRLDMQLERYFPQHERSSFRVLERWQYSYLLIHAYGDATQKWFGNVLSDLITAFEAYDFSALQPEGDGFGEGSGSLFAPAGLLHETSLLAQLGGSGVRGVKPDDARCMELAKRVDKRSNTLFETSHLIQHQLLSLHPALAAQQQIHLPWLAQSDSELAIAGRLTLGIALHLSLFADTPTLAEKYIEALENLSLALDAIPDKPASLARLQPLLSESIETDEEAVLDIPLWQAYRLVAALNTVRLERIEAAWQSLLNDPEELVTEDDFALAYWYVQNMEIAAGPAPIPENAGGPES